MTALMVRAINQDQHHLSHRTIRISEQIMNKRKRLLEAIVLIADIALTIYTKRKKQKQDRR